MDHPSVEPASYEHNFSDEEATQLQEGVQHAQYDRVPEMSQGQQEAMQRQQVADGQRLARQNGGGIYSNVGLPVETPKKTPNNYEAPDEPLNHGGGEGEGGGSYGNVTSSANDESVQDAQNNTDVQQEASPGYKAGVRRKAVLVCFAGLVAIGISVGALLAGIIGATNNDDNDDPDDPDDDEPPAPVDGVEASAEGPDRIRVTWKSGRKGTSYRLLRDGNPVKELTESSHLDIGLQPEKQYCYTVIARRGGHSSAESAKACATTAAEPPPVPVPPTGLTVTKRQIQSLDLEWKPSPGATSYEISRRSSSEVTGSGTLVATVPGSPTQWQDTNLDTDSGYCYTLRSDNESCTWVQSDFVCGVTFNACEEAGIRVVTEFNAPSFEAAFWAGLSSWVTKAPLPSFDCQFNVVRFAEFVSTTPARPVFDTQDKIDAVVNSLLETYESDPNVAVLYESVAGLTVEDKIPFRKEKLAMLARVIARIMKQG